jgi:hypothetical protein
MEQPRIDQSETRAKHSRRKADGRLPRLGLRPLDPDRRLLAPRSRKNIPVWTPAVTSDIASDLPISTAELDAILQLLGGDLASVL